MAESFGATPLHLTEEEPKRGVRAATEGRGVDVVVDAVGDPGPLALAISLARDAGTVSGIGAYAGKGEVPLGLAWLKGLTLRLGLANVIAHVDRVLALIEAGKLDPAPLVTHHMKLDQAAEAYAIYDQPRSAEDRPHALSPDPAVPLGSIASQRNRKLGGGDL